MGESSFWYRPTRVVPDQRPLNGRCCPGPRLILYGHQQIAVHSLIATGTYVITRCYLPPGTADVPALTPAESGTQFCDPDVLLMSIVSRVMPKLGTNGIHYDKVNCEAPEWQLI